MATRKHQPWDRNRTVVLLALAAGLSRAAASSKAGVADRTLRRWVEANESFAEAVEVAMGEGRAVYEELLRAAGAKDWRAALAAYEVIYLGGNRGRAEASATVFVSAPAAQPVLPGQTDEEIVDDARKLVRILIAAVGPDRAAEIIARREQQRRQIG